MTFRGDDRAVTVQIGAVLLFATLIVAMSMYQATVVPEQNANAEYDHNQRVQDQMLDLRNAILRSAATGTSQPTSVAVGMRYPNRLVFVNPPPPAGTLRTGEAANLTISATHVTNEETGDYWNGSHTFETRSLRYEPEYNGYSNAPTTVYESSLLYNSFDNGANVTLADQTMIDGDRITLVTLDGSLSQSRTGSVGVDPRSISPSSLEYRTLSIESGDEIRITVPSRAEGAALWRKALRRQIDGENGSDERHVDRVEQNGSKADIVLEAGQYDLRLAEVVVGDGVAEQSPAYITDASGDGGSVYEDGSLKLVAEVRDRFNNPVGGVTVNESDSNVVAVRPTTDESGRAVFRYRAPTGSSNSDTVHLSFGRNDSSRENVEFDVRVVDGKAPTTGGSNEPMKENFDVGDNSNSNHAKYGVSWSITDSDDDLTNVTVELVDGSNTTVDSTGFDFSATGSRSGTTFLEKKHGAGFGYTIRLTARDGGGHTVSWTVTDTADGNDPS